jgi:hypothetical protein
MADEKKTEEQTPLQTLRVKLVKLHQLSLRIRTSANLVSERASKEDDFLSSEATTAEIEKATKQLEAVDQGLDALLLLK